MTAEAPNTARSGRELAQQLRDRTWSVGALMHAQQVHGQLVSIATASRILGVSRQRAHQLVESGRLTKVQPLLDVNGGEDVFVPLAEVALCPTGLEAGRSTRPRHLVPAGRAAVASGAVKAAPVCREEDAHPSRFTAGGALHGGSGPNSYAEIRDRAKKTESGPKSALGRGL